MAKKAKVRHIVLIGMPSAGKTKVGKRLAKHLGWDFVDIDDRIREASKAKTLEELVSSVSAKRFAQIENNAVITTLRNLTRPTVIATGGSMVYCEEAMGVLARNALVIHLHASLPTILRRVAKRPNRGIVFAPGETMADLYARRMSRYQMWADKTVCTDGHRAKVAKELAKELSKTRC